MMCLACDKELKEHPMPVSLKRKMEMQNDPEIMAKKVMGTVTIDASISNSRPLVGVLFVFARPRGLENGPPLAVKRVRNATFPFDYTIGQIDTMLPGIDFSGEVQITARLDGDGIAGSGPGDLEGKVLAQVGSENNNIVLGEPISRVLKSSKNRGQISGTLNIANAVKKEIPKNPFLFIYARNADAKPGTPPLAVKRLQVSEFPYEFSISETDSMIPGSKIRGDIVLVARLDADGDAKAAPGDVEGRTNVVAGQSGIVLTLDQVVPPKSQILEENGKTVKGMVYVSSELKVELTNPVDRLFIILREKGVSGIPPMAVQLHKNIKFPFKYEIGQKDIMIPGTVLEGEVEVIVRVDRDGNAKASSGDLEGESLATVGAARVDITLKKRI